MIQIFKPTLPTYKFSTSTELKTGIDKGFVTFMTFFPAAVKSPLTTCISMKRSPTTFKVGTRPSNLAVAQARAALNQIELQIEPHRFEIHPHQPPVTATAPPTSAKAQLISSPMNSTPPYSTARSTAPCTAPKISPNPFP